MATVTRRRVLLVEDALPLARVYQEYLSKEPYQVVHAETGRAGLDAIRDQPPAAIILDLQLPDMNGLDILKHVEEQGIPCSVVVITAHGSVNTAVEAMRAGAYDFIVKPFKADRLVYTLRNALERQQLVETVDTYRETFDRREYHGFIGASLTMQGMYRIIDSAAPSKATVFITGESGTGKEICAQAIHDNSPRRARPFIVLNCAAIPKDLMESEVFGHVKGAFTGALAERRGAASLADGGTLFLDEVCEMDLAIQAKLLRFVQTGKFQKVGGDTVEDVDVRFICATNRDPWNEVEKGRFREDIYYRLHVIPIHVPPLRERGNDVLDIARHFLLQFSSEEAKDFEGFSRDVEQLILDHDWPGNVRELQNVVRGVVVLNNGNEVTREMLPELLGGGRAVPGRRDAVVEGALSELAPSHTPGSSPEGVRLRPMKQVEMDYIRQALRESDGNVPRAAALLEISPSTIYRRLREDEGEG